MITDLVEEIYVSMSRNKLRIALTGFSIAWGIFMLIVLLGAGNGLLHGMSQNFASSAVNTVHVWPGHTSVAEDGLPKNRDIWLDVKDLEFLRGQFPREIGEVQPMVESSGTISVGMRHISTQLSGVYPEYVESGKYSILHGRTLNEIDVRERRKVCLLQEQSAEKLFGTVDDGCVGQWVKVDQLQFRVIGIYKSLRQNRDESLFLPLTTMSTIFKPDEHYSEVKLLVDNLNTAEENEAFNDSLRVVMARRKHFSPRDRSGVWIWNEYADYLQTMTILRGLTIFIWLIGIATLIAGVTGISNIMLITVRERTHEFGIRKALGARPREIVSLVLWESVAITLTFGYIGMFFGIGLTQLVGFIMSLSSSAGGEQQGPTVFVDPTVDLNIVLMATLVMVIAGLIAGYVPAKRAVDVKPVEALAAS